MHSYLEACLCCRLLTFFKISFLKKNSFRNTFRVSNSLDPDQDRHYVGPNLGSNCLQWISAYEKGPRQQEKSKCTTVMTVSDNTMISQTILSQHLQNLMNKA